MIRGYPRIYSRAGAGDAPALCSGARRRISGGNRVVLPMGCVAKPSTCRQDTPPGFAPCPSAKQSRPASKRGSGIASTVRVSAAFVVGLGLLAGCENEDDASDAALKPESMAEASSEGKSTKAGEGRSRRSNTEKDQSSPVELQFAEAPLLRFLDQEETVVIRNQAEWNAYVARSDQYLFNPTIDPDDPPCDFSTDMLVVFCFQPHDGCPWTYQGVESVVLQAGTIIVKAKVDSRFIPWPEGPIVDCMVVNVHEGFAVRIPRSELPVEVTLHWY